MPTSITRKVAQTARTVSVFRVGRNDYDYYLVPKGVRLRVPRPPSGRPAFGEALEVLLPSLPSASVRIGHGRRARGAVVVDRKAPRRTLGAMVGLALDRMEAGGLAAETSEASLQIRSGQSSAGGRAPLLVIGGLVLVYAVSRLLRDV